MPLSARLRVIRGSFVAMAAGVASLASPTVGTANGPHPNIVIITVDTLRADSLGTYGAKAATPSIDGLAQAGVLFENAAAPLPLTRPSQFALFTSKSPRELGSINNHTALNSVHRTLAEVLLDAGYDTAAFTTSPILRIDSGIDQGFTTFRGLGYESASEVLQSAGNWLLARKRGAPFFLWVHLFSPHEPYNPPDSFDIRPTSPALEQVSSIGWRYLARVATANDGHLSAAILSRARGLYQGEVDYVDFVLRNFLTIVDQVAPASDTLTVFTADHGECFEHGIYFEHDGCLYEGAIRIPLIVRYPGVIPAGHRTASLARTVDIAPTVLRLAGVSPPKEFRGRSLLTSRGRVAEDAPKTALLEHATYRKPNWRLNRHKWMKTVAGQAVRPGHSGGVYGVRTKRWKLIRYPKATELFDLDVDPGESRNVASENPDLVRRLTRVITEDLAAYPIQADTQAIAPDLKESLKALGYVE